MEAEKEFVKGDKSDKKWSKVNPKKIHEVVNLARLIGESCQNNEVKHVVDIGAGLVDNDTNVNDCTTFTCFLKRGISIENCPIDTNWTFWVWNKILTE
jgi:hypothetical protein